MKILTIDDERLFRWSVSKALGRHGYQVLEASNIHDAKQMMIGEEPDIVILDIHLPDGNGLDTLKWAKNSYPDMMFLMITAQGRVSDAVDAMKSGAYDYLEKPIDMETLIQRVNRTCEMIQLRRELWRMSLVEKEAPFTVIAQSPPMIEALRLAHTVAESGAQTVLLTGESGSGKDILARFIHKHSSRRNQAFMIINCAAVPHALLESELFGHEKGAFTDAKTMKRGILELANEGTVFLDEIGEMDAGMQAKLLRVLEDWTFKRVGGTRDISVNVQVIAATNQNLERLVEGKGFREDLYYRLNVFPITVPPLRERAADIQALATHFINVYNKKLGKNVLGLSEEALDSLIRYTWPGNVRELRNVVERAMILQVGQYIGPDMLLFRRDNGHAAADPLPAVIPLAEAEKSLIQRALSLAHGNVVQAARLLRVSRDTLRYKIKKHQL